MPPLGESSNSSIKSWWNARQVEVCDFFSRIPNLLGERPHPISTESLSAKTSSVSDVSSYESIIVIPPAGQRAIVLDPVTRQPLYQEYTSPITRSSEVPKASSPIAIPGATPDYSILPSTPPRKTTFSQSTMFIPFEMSNDHLSFEAED